MKKSYSFPAMKYTITRNAFATTYRTPLFDLKIHKFMKHPRPLLVFSDGREAASVFVDRKQSADLLRNKFKNHIDRHNTKQKK
jgi:hypothetical protein